MTKVPNIEENSQICNCPNCPTWMASECPKEKEEILYCSRGKTACDLTDQGCVCGACPVFEKYGLTGGYFCFSGEAA